MKQKALSLLWYANFLFGFFKSMIVGYFIMSTSVAVIGWLLYQIIKNVHQ